MSREQAETRFEERRRQLQGPSKVEAEKVVETDQDLYKKVLEGLLNAYASPYIDTNFEVQKDLTQQPPGLRKIVEQVRRGEITPKEGIAAWEVSEEREESNS